MPAHYIMYLPFMGTISCVVSIAAIIIVAFSAAVGKRHHDGPALSKQDYVPVLYVVAATLALLYSFYWNQSYTAFKEYFRLQEEAAQKKDDGHQAPPTLHQLKYGGVDNRAITAADRYAMNLLEQLPAFFLSLLGYTAYVSSSNGAKIGWVWFFFRSIYPYCYKRFPLLFLSTIPAYACVWYMMIRTIYEVTVSTAVGAVDG
jgi:uncharacterized MAPEG superfamily protein